MRKVVVESASGGDAERCAEYLELCLRDSLERGEAPLSRRGLTSEAVDAWADHADALAVYTDLGISVETDIRMHRASATGQQVEMRSLVGEEAEKRGVVWDPQPRCVQSGTGYILHPNDRRVR
jgi:hypothetical protein